MHLVGVLTIHELSFLDRGVGTLMLRGPKMLKMVVVLDASELIEVAGYQFEYNFHYRFDWALKGSAPVLREVGIPHYGVPCCWLQFGHQVFSTYCNSHLAILAFSSGHSGCKLGFILKSSLARSVLSIVSGTIVTACCGVWFSTLIGPDLDFDRRACIAVRKCCSSSFARC